MFKIVTIIGARPQFIKAAAVSRFIELHNNSGGREIKEIIVHTGQHYDKNMSDIFFKEMDIPIPGYNLGIGGGNHGQMTGRQLEKIEEILISERPNAVLVYGDTNSTLAGALAAQKLHIPLVHVESGLRSYNKKMPEEINRILTDHMSDLLLCPTDTAQKNLSQEGISDVQKVHVVGDVMYDAAMYYSNRKTKPTCIEDNAEQFVLLTLHRAENTDDHIKLKHIVDGINEIANEVKVIYPIHPRTKSVLAEKGIELKAEIIEPVSYFEMIWLLDKCSLVITDSGGLQKEAFFFEKPCITIRDQTEWSELIEVGVNRLCSTTKSDIYSSYREAMSEKLVFDRIPKLYGDGNASQKIINKILELIQ